jgi:gluconokinase
MIAVVMGVSGCGKSTIGAALAQRLDVPFFEGDQFHPPENVARMRSGIPLVDAQRVPWIAAIAAAINAALAAPAVAGEGSGVRAVLACSALSATVRDMLRGSLDLPCRWILLHGEEALIRQRLEQRTQHFMPPSLLRSQFEALQVPADAIRFDVATPLPQLLDAVVASLDAVRR